MKSESLNVTVRKAFIRILILGFVWSIFFGLYKISDYEDPGLVSIILFLLCIYAVLEISLVVINYFITKRQSSNNPR